MVTQSPVANGHSIDIEIENEVIGMERRIESVKSIALGLNYNRYGTEVMVIATPCAIVIT